MTKKQIKPYIYLLIPLIKGKYMVVLIKTVITKEFFMKKTISYITLLILTLLICQGIILSDLENLGKQTSGGGFIPYGFAIKFNIFIAVVVLFIVSIIIRKKFRFDMIIWVNLLIIVITAIISYNANIYLFNNVIDRNDFDGDGLSNYYEELVGTNKFRKNYETREFEIRDINFHGYDIVSKITAKIVGKEDYLSTYISDTSKNYYGAMQNFLQLRICKDLHTDINAGVKFDYIEIEVYLKKSYNLNNFYPATYVSTMVKHPGYADYYYEDGIPEKLEYTVDNENNKYIVIISYDLYMRTDLYEVNSNSIYFGLYSD